MTLRLLFLCVALVAVEGACSDEEPACRRNADCASGVCQPDGNCAPAADASPDVTDTADEGVVDAPLDVPADAVSDAGGEPDASADLADADGGSGLCRPNGDGVVERHEIPEGIGLRATFRTATDVPVDLVGTDVGGTRTWDFSSNLPGDRSVIVEFLPLGDRWFGDDFPDADYAALLSPDADTYGVYESTAQAVSMQGVASATDGFDRTILTYDPPVTVLDLPFELGDRWESDSTVTGLALGVPSVFSERYEYEVDARGDLITPYGTLPVLRIRVTLTRTVGVFVTELRSFLFVAECFGTVAVVRSLDNEEAVEFDTAAEILRLAP